MDRHTKIFKRLLEKRVDVNTNATDNGGRTTLEAAVQGGYIDTVKILLEHGAKVNAIAARNRGRTALQAAAEGGHKGTVTLLLRKGAQVSSATADGTRTATDTVVNNRHYDIAKFLVRNGATYISKSGVKAEETINRLKHFESRIGDNAEEDGEEYDEKDDSHNVLQISYS